MKKDKGYFDEIEREIDADGGVWSSEQGRAAYAAWADGVRRSSAYPAALRRVKAQQEAAAAMRRMREHAALTQAEIARRMDVKAAAVSRLERFGATTLQALFGYADACGYRISITAESKADRFAFA